MIKSSMKGEIFRILQMFWNTLNLDFLKLWLFLTISVWKDFRFFVTQDFNNVVEQIIG